MRKTKNKVKLKAKDLDYLRRSLPTGSASRIAEATGFTLSSVCRVLKGEYLNDKVLNLALEYAKDGEISRKKLKLIKK
jgi:hypothetical protein